VRLQVHNDGEPIAAQDLPHLFERFYRADKARTQQNQQGGYGLGLAIAKAIVDAHKGKISVTSTKREGTTFTAEFKERGQ
jgi:two-component system sensor histidine kinase CiaH